LKPTGVCQGQLMRIARKRLHDVTGHGCVSHSVESFLSRAGDVPQDDKRCRLTCLHHEGHTGGGRPPHLFWFYCFVSIFVSMFDCFFVFVSVFIFFFCLFLWFLFLFLLFISSTTLVQPQDQSLARKCKPNVRVGGIVISLQGRVICWPLLLATKQGQGSFVSG